MKFQTLTIVKHPLPRVWLAMRDEMAQLAGHLDDIESITMKERTETEGIVSIANVWHAKPKLPDLIARHVDTSKFIWIDHASWDGQAHVCRWRIEPQVFSAYFSSSGETRFEPAMGGKGTRITFCGAAEIKVAKDSDGVPKILEDTIFKGAVSFIQGIIVSIFRKMADAVAKHLGAEQLTPASSNS